MSAIERAGTQELAWNGKPVRNSEEEVTVILAPMFALFPQTNADKNTFAVYVRMLRDIDPQVLSSAVLKAMNCCKFLPTVAEIREQIPTRAPGPASPVDPATLKDIPLRMFRLPDDEDKRQRMEQLRRTRGWKYDL
jgi:hypothetical protein